MNSLWEGLLQLLGVRRRPKAPPPPPVQYSHAVQSESAPAVAQIATDTVHLVIVQGQPRWAMLHCPCGCQEVITLSLQPVHRPHWKAFLSRDHRISLRPSVWRAQGCRSHFILDDGRVYWA